MPEALAMEPDGPAQTACVSEKFTDEYAVRLLHHANLDQVSLTNDGNDLVELVVLDEACGLGTVSLQLLRMLDDKTRERVDLTLLDISKPLLDYAEQRFRREGWKLKALRTLQADATNTGLPASCFTHILLGFGPMMFADWRAAIREIHRMLRPGGLVAMSTWGEGGWLPDVRAALASDPSLPNGPSAHELQEAWSPESNWSEPQWIEKVLQEFDFEDIQVKSEPRTSVLDGMEELVTIVPLTLGNLIGKCWTEEQAARHASKAKETMVRYVNDKYGTDEIRWNWVANLMVARKAL